MAELSVAAARQLQYWREEGEQIVFTNGVFDILHPGHIVQLRQARAFGERLVVGLNSDASAKALGKGDCRPILPQDARATLLGELRCVDLVLLFDEETPEALIKLVHPDVLVKGADYRDKCVAGAEFVESYGGRVELIELVPGYSTSAIIERIKRDC